MTSTGVHRMLEERLADVAARHKGDRTPALSYAVATVGGLAAAGAVGTADLQEGRAASPEDQFPWFSMTKIATATTVTRLEADGLIDTGRPVRTYLPGFSGGRHGEPTVRQLLTHTAGLANPLPVRWVRPLGQPADPALVAGLVRKHGRPRRTPAGRASYSNIGYLVAGQVIEAVTGMPVERAIEDLVLRPLGMGRTRFDFDPTVPRATGYVRAPRPLHPLLRRLLPPGIVGERIAGYTSLQPFLVEGAAYGGLVGPATDAVRLAQAHLPQAAVGHSPLGDLSAMTEIEHPGKPFDHGTGWFRRPEDAARTPAFVEHYGTGGGFWNAMRIYPTLGVAVVGMTNNTAPWPFDAFFTAVVDVCAS